MTTSTSPIPLALSTGRKQGFAVVALPLRRIAAHLGHSDMLMPRLFRFGTIGGITAVGYAVEYGLLSFVLPDQLANLVTLVSMTMANTALNRHFTFGRTGRKDLHIHYLAGVLAFLIAWTVTAGGLAILHLIGLQVSHLVESLWVTAFTLVGTAVKYGVFAISFQRREPAGT